MAHVRIITEMPGTSKRKLQLQAARDSKRKKLSVDVEDDVDVDMTNVLEDSGILLEDDLPSSDFEDEDFDPESLI